MRTIVINTSVEAKKTNLHTLFKVPFDQSCLIWFDDVGLDNISKYPDIIKCELIDNADAVDKNYNLIVLVDTYTYPRGQEKNISEIYEVLLTKYIATNLTEPLKSSHDIVPSNTAIFFVDSYSISNPNIAFAGANPEEVKEKERIRTLEVEERNKSVRISEDGTIDKIYTADVKEPTVSIFRQNILDIFPLSPKTTSKDIPWNKTKLENLDFSKVFEEIQNTINASDDTVNIIDFFVGEMENLVSSHQTTGNDGVKTLDVSNKILKNHIIKTFSFDIVTENQQDLLIGYFKVFANIFACVQQQTIINSIITYNEEEIKSMLVKALKKYRFFSEEENIKISIEPVKELFDARSAISAERKKLAKSESNSATKSPDELLRILPETKLLKSEDVLPIFKPTAADKRFGEIAAEIFNNYNPEIIKTQNDTIIKECLKGFWNWRDKQTDNDFLNIANSLISSNSHKSQEKTAQSSADMRADIIATEECLEKEYSDIISDITKTDYRLASNDNVLLETKNLIIKYVDIAKKGRKYLLSRIGAIIAVIIAILPFIFIQGSSFNENILHKILYILFTAGFAALYCTAINIYYNNVRRKKIALISALETYKKQSCEERLESIRALLDYYQSTIVDAESHYLLKKEITRRNESNARKLMMRNNHIVRLNHLERKVKRFITILKIDADLEQLNDTSKDKDDFTNLELDGEKSYHDPQNQAIYSVLDYTTNKNAREEENK